MLGLSDNLAVHSVKATYLPPEWQKQPAPKGLIDMGFRIGTEMRERRPRIPSAVIPSQAGEGSVLLNTPIRITPGFG